MENNFKDILTKEEKIISVYKPHKGRFFAESLLTFVIGWLFIFGMYLLFYFANGSADDPVSPKGLMIALFVLLGVLVLTFALTFIGTKVCYDKRFYAYTNKRIIVRTGLIGVDYKSLDIAQIGAINVRVDLLDKVFKSVTGTIRFGSMASPINSQQGSTPFAFRFVEKPYEIYCVIKEDMDNKNGLDIK